MLASSSLVSFIRDEGGENMPWCRFVVMKEKLQLRFTYKSFLHTSVHINVTRARMEFWGINIPLWQRKQLLVQRQQNLTEFLVIWISSTRNPASFVLVGRSRLNKKTFTYNHKLSRLYWLNFSLQKQLSVGFNKLHTFKMIAKRYVQKTTKGA